MIISQAPLRISLFGGGSDLPAYLENNNGAVLSFAINRRIFIVGHPFIHRSGIVLKYSKQEDVAKAEDLQHPIAREILTRYSVSDIDIAIMSDVPAGTGLGSSSSFTVALLSFVRHINGLKSTSVDLAKEACEIEIEILQEPIGYQDQWASALGGLNLIKFNGNHSVSVEKIGLTAEALGKLESSLLLVPIGSPRSASKLLKEQSESLSRGSRAAELTSKLVSQVEIGKQALLSDVELIGPLLHEAWMVKKEISSGVSSPHVDEAYEYILNSGATGGKLLGAGGSGYLACFVPENKRTEFKKRNPFFTTIQINQSGAGIIHES